MKGESKTAFFQGHDAGKVGFPRVQLNILAS